MNQHEPRGPQAGTPVRRSRSPRLVSLLLSGLLATAQAACSSDAASGGAEASPPSATPPAAPEPDPAKEACAAETARLQAGLDKARDPNTDAVLALQNPGCGLRVLTSGPSKQSGKELHRIGSVTKSYVAAVVVTLAHEGALGLDDAVTKWVANVPNGDAITVRQLLNHTSGLFNYTEDKPFRSHAVTKDHLWAPRDLLDVSFAHPPDFAPGQGWHYSNTNYVMLGLVAEAAGKPKIGALVRTRVLAPIGATATFFDGEEPLPGALALGVDALGRDMRVVGPSWAWAAGAMVATPADVVLWIDKLGSGAFHDAGSQKEVFTTVATDEKAMRYGLGLMVLDAMATGGAGTGYGHAGDTPGYHTQAFYFPKSKTTIVSIVDSDVAPANDVTAAALKVLF
jgi:D-alanyl-D-alanine carboxypeptidase